MTGTLCQIGLLSRGGGVLPRVRNAGRRLPFRHHAADVFRGLNDEAARVRERVGRAARRARVLAAGLPAVEARVAALDEGDLDVARAEKRDKSGEAARARNLLEPRGLRGTGLQLERFAILCFKESIYTSREPKERRSLVQRNELK